MIQNQMKAICCALVLFLGNIISRAEAQHWRNEDELGLWIRSKESLEISEYVEVWESLKDWNREAPLKTDNATEIAKLSWKLIFEKFQSFLDARNYDAVYEIFEGICGYHGVNSEMMDALTNCRDVEFVARVVHRSLDRISWDNRRGFSPPIVESRRILFDKIIGESETYKRVISEYGMMNRLAQGALKSSLEKAWPEILEENTREPRRTPPIQKGNQATVDSADSRNANSGGLSINDLMSTPFLLVAGLVFLAVTSIVIIVRRRHKSGQA